MILFDLDDFDSSERSDADFQRLVQLKEEFPTLKVTLFTIPEGTSKLSWLTMARHSDWIDLVQHGWHHRTNYECLSWTKADCKAALRRGREMGFTTKGFKAPGWQISDGCYEALAEEGYWVADQMYNQKRGLSRLYSLTTYCINSDNGVSIRNSPFVERTYKDSCDAVEKASGARPNCLAAGPHVIRALHGHIGHMGGHNANALELIMDDVRAAAALDSDFRFIREVMA